jgi:hypothetical protein
MQRKGEVPSGMRTSIIFIALLSLPAAMVVHWLIYEDQYRPHLISKARSALRDMGIRQADVSLIFLDAAITGIANSEKNRELAAQAVREIRGLRLSEADNRIIIPASINGELEESILTLRGWLPDDGSQLVVLNLIRSLRPDVTVVHDDLHVSPHVRVPEGIQTPFNQETPMIAEIIRQLRIPADFEMHRLNGRYELSGHLPHQALKDRIIEVIKHCRPSLDVDAARLTASQFVDPAPFTTGDGLIQFLESYCSVPEPGDFSIATGSGPILAGAATRELEGRWLALLRPLSGTFKVSTRLSIRPSLFHLPGYEVTSQIPSELRAQMQESLRHKLIEFPDDTLTIRPEDDAMLSALTADLFAAGPALHLIVGAHPSSEEPNDEAKAMRRAEFVLNRLVELGIPSDNLHPMVFDALPPGASGGAETGVTYANSVELLLR